MAKVFITGGAGFIGSYICKKLIARGDKPIIYDALINFATPFNTEHGKILGWRTKGIRDKVTLIRGDIRDKEHLRKSIEETKPTHIIHLAALPIATKAREMPEEAVSINLLGTTNLLEAVRGMEIERFIYTSSSFRYGNFKSPLPDEETRCKPLDIYGSTKLAGETLVKGYANEYDMNYSIIIPSGVYGFGDTNQRVTQIFIERAMNNQSIYLEDGGNQKIDFTYVEDVADGFILAMEKREAKNRTFNITFGHSRSVKELSDIINSIIPFKSIEHKTSTIRRPERGTLNISKAILLLGYDPKYSLEEGIKKTIEDYKKWMT